MSTKGRILVVDDSATMRRIIRRELEAGGYSVVEAGTGKQALYQASRKPFPALVTLDIEMPEMDGFETCRRLQGDDFMGVFADATDAHLPVVFVTSNDTLEDRRTGFDLGAADFIVKPFARGELLAVVDSILRPDDWLKGVTALVVDDSPLALRIVRESLEQEGVRVHQAVNGVEATTLLHRHLQEIDIVITDLVMAPMDGAQLCATIRGELGQRQMPIIVLTSINDTSRLLEVFRAGATDYLTKPFIKEELLARINVHIVHSQLNRKLRDTVVELHGLNQMKDDLLAICSHDLRTPLNGILGFTDLLLEEEHHTQADRETLGQIRLSGEFLLGLINDILDLAKLESGTSELALEPVSLFGILQASVQALGYLATAKNQKVQVASACSRDTIQGNRNGLVRVTNNLLSNAIKFTPEGGEIRLSVESCADDKVRVRVEDSGVGIPAARLPQLFDRYTRASRSGTEGEASTGLGLSIVKEMVERHGGTVEVDSTEGKGTCFTLTFPRSQLEETDPAAVAATRACVTREVMGHPGSDVAAAQTPGDGEGDNGDTAAGAVDLAGLRVLLAEDDRISAMVAQAMLRKEHCLTTTVGDGELAVGALESATYDIILMDRHMPGVDGLEAARRIRSGARQADIPIVALTASVSADDVRECLAAGMNAHLEKPLERDRLRAALQQWTRRAGD